MDSVLRWIGYGLCHQLPERSFFGGGFQVPVCARDTGIYVGIAAALLVLAILGRGRRPSELPPLPVSVLLASFVALMILDGFTSYAGLRSTDNDVRLLTGLLAGYAIGALTMPLVNGQLWRHSGTGRILARGRDVVWYLGSVVPVFAAIRWVGPALGSTFPVLVAGAILVSFTAVNLIIVCLWPAFERRASRLRDSLLPVVVAFGLTLLELWAAGVVRAWLDRLAGLVA